MSAMNQLAQWAARVWAVLNVRPTTCVICHNAKPEIGPECYGCWEARQI